LLNYKKKILLIIFCYLFTNIDCLCKDNKNINFSIDYGYLWHNRLVHDQGELNNCHLFAFLSALESRHYKDNKELILLSPLDLFYLNLYKIRTIFDNSGFLNHPMQNFIPYNLGNSLESGNQFINLDIIKKYGTTTYKKRPYPQRENLDYCELLEKTNKLNDTWKKCKQMVAFSESRTYSQWEKQRKIIKDIFMKEGYNNISEDFKFKEFKEDRYYIKKFTKKIKIKSVPLFYNLPNYSIEKILQHLTCNPIIISVVDSNNLDSKNTANHYRDPSHDILLIGYNSKTKKVRIRNSYGVGIEEYNKNNFATHIREAHFLYRKYEKKKNCTKKDNHSVQFYREGIDNKENY
jgi:hypothetical protein